MAFFLVKVITLLVINLLLITLLLINLLVINLFHTFADEIREDAVKRIQRIKCSLFVGYEHLAE